MPLGDFGQNEAGAFAKVKVEGDLRENGRQKNGRGETV